MSNAPAWTRDKYNDTDSPAGAKYPFPSAPLGLYDIKEPPPYSNSDGFPLYKQDAKHGKSLAQHGKISIQAHHPTHNDDDYEERRKALRTSPERPTRP
jgi:hypothetical protein